MNDEQAWYDPDEEIIEKRYRSFLALIQMDNTSRGVHDTLRHLAESYETMKADRDHWKRLY